MKRVVVLFVIACFLRAFLPCDGSRIDVARSRGRSEPTEFRCEGHGCCCETIEQCAISCCCFPESESDVEPESRAHAVATLAPHGAREVQHVITAPSCGGELPNPAVVTFTGIVAIVPVRARVAPAPSSRGRSLSDETSPHTTRRPSPEAPPPRSLSHVS